MVLKTRRAIVLFPLSRWIQHEVQVQVWGRSLKIIIVIHIRDIPQDASHNIVCTNMKRGKATTQNSASHSWFGWVTTALIPILYKNNGLCILYLSTLFDSWVWMNLNSKSLKSNSKWINVFHLLNMFPMVGLHMFYSMLITLLLVNENP